MPERRDLHDARLYGRVVEICVGDGAEQCVEDRVADLFVGRSFFAQPAVHNRRAHRLAHERIHQSCGLRLLATHTLYRAALTSGRLLALKTKHSHNLLFIKVELHPFIVYDLAADREYDHLDRYVAPGPLPRRLCKTHKTLAARHLHHHHGQGVYPRAIYHLDEFVFVHLRVVVEFRAGDGEHLPAQETAVELTARECRAVGRQQQVGSLKKSGLRIHQMQLNRELSKFRGLRLQTGPREIELRSPDLARRRPRTAAGQRSVFTSRLTSLHRRLVERLGLALLQRYRTHGTITDTGSQPVAIAVAHHHRLTIHELQRTLVAPCDARAAAVAPVSVDLYYRPFHGAKLRRRGELNRNKCYSR